MMRAGKDYAVEVPPEYEDGRSQHLLELIETIKAQKQEPITDEPEALKPNQSKPTLKLR